MMNKMHAPLICFQYYHAPCGELILASIGNELCLCDWCGMPCAERNMRRIERGFHAGCRLEESDVLQQARQELDEYFAGVRTTFDIRLHPVGTEFQMQVWSALLEIPYGETRSYKAIAQHINNPKGVRAVAQAIGANGIGILIPCHRVIGSNHALTGFAGGLDKKTFLLRLEEKTERVTTQVAWI